ncbi:hypothetical protein KR093_010451, partial [Drosophila rubida]
SSSSSGCSSEQQSSSMASNCECCLVPRYGFKRLLQKLRRTLKRHWRPRHRRFGDFRRRSHSARTPLLRPMPRCSSFGSCPTLPTPTKPATPTDTRYAKWKCMFEHATSSGTQASMPSATAGAQRPHNISGALSGQTTPRGFPSHTDARRCAQLPQPQPQPQPQSQFQPVVEQPLYDLVAEQRVRRHLSFRLPLLTSSSSSSSSSGHSGHSGHSSYSSRSMRRLTARQKAAQAKVEAQLQRELYDLEDYYGGFHYARRNERRI